MTLEQIKKKAEEYVENKVCDVGDYSCGYLPSTVEEMLVEFATEATKELQIPCKSCHLSLPQDLIDENKELTKAKEIIRKFYRYIFLGESFMELNDFNVWKNKAEAFINKE